MLEQALYFGVCLIPVCRNFKGALQAAVAPVLEGAAPSGTSRTSGFPWFVITIVSPSMAAPISLVSSVFACLTPTVMPHNITTIVTTASLSTTSFHKNFPSLAAGQTGANTVFFDGAAGTQICQRSLDRMTEALIDRNANFGGFFRLRNAPAHWWPIRAPLSSIFSTPTIRAKSSSARI